MSQWVKLSALRIILHDKQVEGKLRSKFTRWPPSWILSFPGQRTTTATSCIPNNSVYMPGPCAGKSENGVLSEQRATEKSTKMKILSRMKERISMVTFWWGKGENVLNCLQESKEKKSICKSLVDASISNIQRSQSMLWRMTTKLWLRVRVRVSRHVNSVMVWERVLAHSYI